MKKNISRIISCIIALVVGYVLGAYIGLPSVDQKATTGDVNTINSYQQMLLQPEYMSFNDQMKGNTEIQDRTIESLQIVENRLKAFAVMVEYAQQEAKDNAALAKPLEAIVKTAAEGAKVYPDVKEALKAAQDLKAGNKTDAKKALKIAARAFAVLQNQMKSSKEFVNAVDTAIGQNPKADTGLATARDLLVSHCAVNAVLCQNDEDIDFWQNTTGLLSEDDMAVIPVIE